MSLRSDLEGVYMHSKRRFINILERKADEWLNDDDYWIGYPDCDINVSDDFDEDGEYRNVSIYGVEIIYDDSNGESYLQTDTGNLIESFNFRIKEVV